MIKTVNYGDKILIYNLNTDALVAVNNSNVPVEELLKKEEILKFLKDNLVIFDKGIDEKKISKYVLNKSKYGRDQLLITDASSYKCNLRCVYCMQQNTFKNVNEINVKERVDIWQNLIEASGLQSAAVVLFGGEPFLNLNYVNDLLTEATSRNLPIDHYSAVTNGVNLDVNSVKLLNKFPFSKLQITLDGTEKVHDARRYHANKAGSFKTIIANLHTIFNHTKISVIINSVLDKGNLNDYIEMVKFLLKEFPSEIRTARMIFNVGRECHPAFKSQYTNENILKEKEYAKVVYDAIDFLIENDCEINQLKPSPICMRLSENDIMISPDGSLYKCISGLGMDRFKLISKDKFLEKPYMYILMQSQWCEKDVDMECEKCPYLFLCNGGCEYNAFIQGTKKECNKEYLSAAIDRLILAMGKYLERKGELVEWNM